MTMARKNKLLKETLIPIATHQKLLKEQQMKAGEHIAYTLAHWNRKVAEVEAKAAIGIEIAKNDAVMEYKVNKAKEDNLVWMEHTFKTVDSSLLPDETFLMGGKQMTINGALQNNSFTLSLGELRRLGKIFRELKDN